MVISRLFGVALFLSAGMSLSACETMRGAQVDMNSNFSHIRTALENFTTSQPDDADTTSVALADAGSQSCPDVRIVQDLNQIHQFTDPNKPDESETVASVTMTGVDEKCVTVKNNLAIDMTLAFQGNLGPKAKSHSTDKPSFAYPYFVAITNNQGSIISKEVFAVTMSYDGKTQSAAQSEQIRQMIPLNDPHQKNYKVLIGFQLSEQELAYNRNLSHQHMIARSANALSVIEPAAGLPGQE